MFTIVGKRWFDRLAGNTYHSVEVYQEEKLLVRVPFAYGYGDGYKQTAFKELVRLGHYSDERTASGHYHDFRRFAFSKESDGDGNLFLVSDVARKKDL